MTFDAVSYSLAKRAYSRTKISTNTISLPHALWTNGLTNEEICRIQLQSGEVFRFLRGEMQIKGGGSDVSLYIDVYDATSDTVIATIQSGTVNTTQNSSSAGALILIRVTNTTGADQVASFSIDYTIE